MLICSESADNVLNCSESAEDVLNCSESAEDVLNCSESADGVLNCSRERAIVPTVAEWFRPLGQSGSDLWGSAGAAASARRAAD